MQLRSIEQDGTVDLAGADSSLTLEDVIDATVALYGRKGFEPPWIGYVALESGQVVGSCGFAAPPSGNEAEIAYFTFPGHEGTGVATRMARALLSLSGAAARAQGIRFIAHTLPTESASTSVLKKLGFSLFGIVHHPEDGAVWKWVRHEGPAERLEGSTDA